MALAEQGAVGSDYARTVLLLAVVGLSSMGALGSAFGGAIAGDAHGGPESRRTLAVSRQAGGIWRAADVALGVVKTVDEAAAAGAHVVSPSERYAGHLISTLRSAEGADESLRFAAARALMEPRIDRAFVQREAGLLTMTGEERVAHAVIRKWRGDWLASDLLFQATGLHLPVDHAGELWERIRARLRHPALRRTRSLEEAVPRVSNPPMGVINDRRALLDALALAYDNRSGFFRQDTIKTITKLAIQSAAELGMAVSVTFLDFDHFKRINNVFGHQIGEAVIKKVTTAIAGSVRDSDLVFRYGGDEFVVVSPDVTPEEAKRIATRIQTAVADEVDAQWLRETLVRRGLAHLLPEVGSDWRQTISAGVVHSKDPGDPAELIRQADMAMYDAKDGGRNTVHLTESH